MQFTRRSALLAGLGAGSLAILAGCESTDSAIRWVDGLPDPPESDIRCAFAVTPLPPQPRTPLDGSRVAVDFAGEPYVSFGGQAVWDVASGQILNRTDELRADAEFWPDGTLFFADVQYVVNFNPATGAYRHFNTGHRALQDDCGVMRGVVSMAISPDGKRLVTAGWDRHLSIFDLEAGTRMLRRPVLEGSAARVALVGDRVLVAETDRQVRVLDLGGEQLATGEFRARELLTRGERVLALDSQWQVVDSNTWRVQSELDIPQGHVTLAPDGDRLVAAPHERSGEDQVVVIHNLATSETVTHHLPGWGGAIGSTGELLATRQETVVAYDVTTGAEIRDFEKP